MQQQQPKKPEQQQQGGQRDSSKQQQQSTGPDNPSKHSMKDPVNKEPHRESGEGRHEPHP